MNLKPILLLCFLLGIFSISSCGSGASSDDGIAAYRVQFANGWHQLEQNKYRWSDGVKSKIKLINKKKGQPATFKLEMAGHYFHPTEPSAVYQGQTKLGDIVFKEGKCILPLELDGVSNADFVIRHHNVKSPKELNLSGDDRKIKLNLKYAKIR